MRADTILWLNADQIGWTAAVAIGSEEDELLAVENENGVGGKREMVVVEGRETGRESGGALRF